MGWAAGVNKSWRVAVALKCRRDTVGDRHRQVQTAAQGDATMTHGAKITRIR